MTWIFQVQYLYFTSIFLHSPHFNTRICAFFSITSSKQTCCFGFNAFERNVDYFYICTSNTRLISTYQWKTRKDKKDKTRWKQAKRETWTGRWGVLVSRMCRDVEACCLDFLIFLICCCACDALPIQNVSIWRPGKETQQWNIFLAH